MPFKVTRMPGEPIIVVEAVPPFGRDEVDDTNERVYRAARDIATRVFRISDVRALDITFESIQETLAEHQGGEPGSITDPKMIPVFVGGGEFSKMLADGFSHEAFGGKEILLFGAMDDAMHYIRDRIARGAF